MQFKGKTLLKDCIITDGDSKGKNSTTVHKYLSRVYKCRQQCDVTLSQAGCRLLLLLFSLWLAPPHTYTLHTTYIHTDVKNAFQLANLQKSGSKDVWVTNSPKEKDLWTEDITKAIETLHTQDSTRYVFCGIYTAVVATCDVM